MNVWTNLQNHALMHEPADDSRLFASRNRKAVLMFRRATIVSKVSLALALIIESAMPDFSHFEFAKIRFLSHPHNLSFIFDCKSTTITRNLFALCLFLLAFCRQLMGNCLNLTIIMDIQTKLLFSVLLWIFLEVSVLVLADNLYPSPLPAAG